MAVTGLRRAKILKSEAMADDIRRMYTELTTDGNAFSGLSSFHANAVRKKYTNTTSAQVHQILLTIPAYAQHFQSKSRRRKWARDNIRAYGPGRSIQIDYIDFTGEPSLEAHRYIAVAVDNFC